MDDACIPIVQVARPQFHKNYSCTRVRNVLPSRFESPIENQFIRDLAWRTGTKNNITRIVPIDITNTTRNMPSSSSRQDAGERERERERERKRKREDSPCRSIQFPCFRSQNLEERSLAGFQNQLELHRRRGTTRFDSQCRRSNCYKLFVTLPAESYHGGAVFVRGFIRFTLQRSTRFLP